MSQRRFWDYTQYVLEIVLIVYLVVAGISLLIAEPISAGGPVTQLIGHKYATYFYSVVFIGEGIFLTVSKALRRKTLHKHTLLMVYLTLLFTILLEFVLGGFSLAMSDNIIAAMAAGWCWLRWKFKTEYISAETFARDVEKLRDDVPPFN